MVFSRVTLRRCWKLAQGRCECQRIGHRHLAPCNRPLVFERLESDEPGARSRIPLLCTPMPTRACRHWNSFRYLGRLSKHFVGRSGPEPTQAPKGLGNSSDPPGSGCS